MTEDVNSGSYVETLLRSTSRREQSYHVRHQLSATAFFVVLKTNLPASTWKKLRALMIMAKGTVEQTNKEAIHTTITMAKTKTRQGPRRFIKEPTSLDVLCGKTKECMVHAGTKRFRFIIESYRASYDQAATKFDKMTVTLTIFDLVKSTSSRFLKYNKAEGAWEELSSKAARDKVSHDETWIL